MATWEKIASDVQGTKLAIEEIAENYEVNADDVESELELHGVEFCVICGVWLDSASIDEDGYCEECADDV